MSMHMLYKYQIYDKDIGGIIYDVLYNDFDQLLEIVKRDIDSYCSDFPDDIEKDPTEEYDEQFWDTKTIFHTLSEFQFLGGLLEWTCWFPGHHRKVIVSMTR